jgi:outer membrane protein OmpA-like peptidoglycan-associated protein
MKTAWLLGAALLLSACAAPQQAYYAPPAPRTAPAHIQPRVTAPAAPRPIAQQPIRVPQTVPSAGPLRTAMVGGYMDNQERDLREHLRGLGVGVARPGDQIVLGLLESKIFDGSGTDFTRSGQDTLAIVAVILRHYDHTAVTVRAFNDGAAGKGAAGPEDRAQAVAHALIVDGVPRARIFAQGYGATRRVMATGRRISVPGDRRIEIRITPLARS